MLINTVVLFLSDALPMIIIITLLLTNKTKQRANVNWLYQGIFIGTFSTIILTFNLDRLAQLFDDKGLELLFSFAYLIIYFCICFLMINENFNQSRKKWHYTAVAIVTLSLSINGSDFLLYLTGYWSQVDAIQSLIIGITLGTGICISIGVLLYFFILYSEYKISRKISSILILLFGAGQLLKGSNLLFQIDLLPIGRALWDLNYVIKENSELGRFLTALVGYDASPSKLELIIYIIALILPVTVILISRKIIKEHSLENDKSLENL